MPPEENPPPSLGWTMGEPKVDQGCAKGEPKLIQKWLDLPDDERTESRLRNALSPLRLREREVRLLVMVAIHGSHQTLGEELLSMLKTSERNAMKLANCSRQTFRRAVANLVDRGVLLVQSSTRPWTYIVNRSRVALLEPAPPEPSAELAAAVDFWSTHGPPLRDSVNNSNNKIRSVSYSSVSSVYTDGMDQTWRDHPWHQKVGVTVKQLREAVGYNDPEVPRVLYMAGVRLGWWANNQDNALRLLTLCHHCATSSGLHNPMAVLVKRASQNLRVGHVRQASEDWAAAMLRSAHRDPELAARTCATDDEDC